MSLPSIFTLCDPPAACWTRMPAPSDEPSLVPALPIVLPLIVPLIVIEPRSFSRLIADAFEPVSVLPEIVYVRLPVASEPSAPAAKLMLENVAEPLVWLFKNELFWSENVSVPLPFARTSTLLVCPPRNELLLFTVTVLVPKSDWM